MEGSLKAMEMGMASHSMFDPGKIVNPKRETKTKASENSMDIL
jgi:hypothetical protein